MRLKFFFNSQPLWDKGYALIRIFTGFLLIYHGWEVFDSTTMAGYSKWLTELGFPWPPVMGYLGKGSEFVCGVCLVLGLGTRLAAIVLIINMTAITFGMGHGKIFSDDQHPFLFALLGAIFLFSGPGAWSLDSRINLK